MMVFPTPVEPVKPILRTSMWSVIAWPTIRPAVRREGGERARGGGGEKRGRRKMGGGVRGRWEGGGVRGEDKEGRGRRKTGGEREMEVVRVRGGGEVYPQH